MPWFGFVLIRAQVESVFCRSVFVSSKLVGFAGLNQGRSPKTMRVTAGRSHRRTSGGTAEMAAAIIQMKDSLF
ncbi:MAG TPA: hypothetical protein DC047_02640 [Blastocatellia bacterium]|nr:hypothetical protein [Blastocatellia bacterium]